MSIDHKLPIIVTNTNQFKHELSVFCQLDEYFENLKFIKSDKYIKKNKNIFKNLKLIAQINNISKKNRKLQVFLNELCKRIQILKDEIKTLSRVSELKKSLEEWIKSLDIKQQDIIQFIIAKVLAR